jgi:AraC-like DNA-binding protein
MFEAHLLTLPNRADQHAHAHWQLVLPQRGRVAFGVANKHFELSARQALALAADELHAFEGYQNNRIWLINWVPPQPLDGWSTHLQPLLDVFEYSRQLSLSKSLRNWIELTLQQCASYSDASYSDASYSDLSCAKTGFSGLSRSGVSLRQPPEPYLISILMSIAHEHSRFSREPLTTLTAGHVSQVLDYIQSHLGDALRVDELAKLMRLSSTQFHRRFREATGESPRQYILKARLERAKQLITVSELPLSCIAFDVGFSSQSALTNAMKRYLNTTPAQLRR